jgi:hypothetical protein
MTIACAGQSGWPPEHRHRCGPTRPASAGGAWSVARPNSKNLIGIDAVRELHGQLDATLAQVTPLLEEPVHADPH